MEYSIVVAATASIRPMQFLAPFAARMGEFFRDNVCTPDRL